MVLVQSVSQRARTNVRPGHFHTDHGAGIEIVEASALGERIDVDVTQAIAWKAERPAVREEGVKAKFVRNGSGGGGQLSLLIDLIP